MPAVLFIFYIAYSKSRSSILSTWRRLVKVSGARAKTNAVTMAVVPKLWLWDTPVDCDAQFWVVCETIRANLAMCMKA